MVKIDRALDKKWEILSPPSFLVFGKLVNQYELESFEIFENPEELEYLLGAKNLCFFFIFPTRKRGFLKNRRYRDFL